MKAVKDLAQTFTSYSHISPKFLLVSAGLISACIPSLIRGIATDSIQPSCISFSIGIITYLFILIHIPNGDPNKTNVFLTLVIDTPIDDNKLLQRRIYQPLKDQLEQLGINVVKPNYFARLFYDSMVSTNHKNSYFKRKYMSYVWSKSCASLIIDGNINYEKDTDKLIYRFYINIYDADGCKHIISLSSYLANSFDAITQIIKTYILLTNGLNSTPISTSIKEINKMLYHVDTEISALFFKNEDNITDTILSSIAEKLIDFAQNGNPPNYSDKLELWKICKWILRTKSELPVNLMRFYHNLLYESHDKEFIKEFAEDMVKQQFKLNEINCDKMLIDVEKAYCYLILGDCQTAKELLESIDDHTVFFDFINKVKNKHPIEYTLLFRALYDFCCNDNFESRINAKRTLIKISKSANYTFAEIALQILDQIQFRKRTIL